MTARQITVHSWSHRRVDIKWRGQEERPWLHVRSQCILEATGGLTLSEEARRSVRDCTSDHSAFLKPQESWHYVKRPGGASMIAPQITVHSWSHRRVDIEWRGQEERPWLHLRSQCILEATGGLTLSEEARRSVRDCTSDHSAFLKPQEGWHWVKRPGGASVTARQITVHSWSHRRVDIEWRGQEERPWLHIISQCILEATGRMTLSEEARRSVSVNLTENGIGIAIQLLFFLSLCCVC